MLIEKSPEYFAKIKAFFTKDKEEAEPEDESAE